MVDIITIAFPIIFFLFIAVIGYYARQMGIGSTVLGLLFALFGIRIFYYLSFAIGAREAQSLISLLYNEFSLIEKVIILGIIGSPFDTFYLMEKLRERVENPAIKIGSWLFFITTMIYAFSVVILIFLSKPLVLNTDLGLILKNINAIPIANEMMRLLAAYFGLTYVVMAFIGILYKEEDAPMWTTILSNVVLALLGPITSIVIVKGTPWLAGLATGLALG